MKENNIQVQKFGQSNIQPKPRHPIDQFDQLNALKEQIKPAFHHSIRWVVDNKFFAGPSSFTLMEFVPRRFFGDKQVVLARFERETKFSKGSLTVYDDRVRVQLKTHAPTALVDCAKALARVNEVCVTIL